MDEILKEIAFFKESVYYMKEHCSELDCPKNGFKKIVEEVISILVHVINYFYNKLIV